MQCHVTVPLMVASKQMNADQAVNAMSCKIVNGRLRECHNKIT